MEALANSEVLLFEGFRLERRGLFWRDAQGVFVPVAIGTRALDLLRVLIAALGDIVSKDEIMAAVWPGTVVEDNNLTVQIAALRRTLDRDRPEGGCIQTVAGRGYRFVATVTQDAREAAFNRAAVSGGGVPPRLSVVVLPFTNLSGDPDQEYFADGITDDLTTYLSGISESFVIACTTAFTYKGKAVEARQVGRELGVRYVLEGSVRRFGNHVRVNTRLIDAETDAHLWAERFDSDTSDLFTLQNEITGQIAIALDLELVAREAARVTEHPDALDYIFRGRAAVSNLRSPKTYAEGISFFERALEVSPGSVTARSWLTLTLANRVMNQVSDTTAADTARAETLVEQALERSPRSPLAHYAKGQLLRAQRRYAEAVPEFELAVASNRNWVTAIAHLGQCKFLVGAIEEAIPAQEQAIRLSPRDPEIGVWYYRIGQAHLLQSRNDEAVLWLEKARGAEPLVPVPHAYLACVYALKGQSKRAAAELAEARRLSHDDRYSSISRLRAVELMASERPKIRALFEATYLAGLRKAGMPED